MFLTASLLLLAAAPDCGDPNTATGRREIRLGKRSCGDPDPAEIPNRAPTAAEQQRAKAAFDEMAYDGPTARWRFEFVKRNELVCGHVNGKNALGAYTGWMPFVFSLKDGSFSTYRDQQWLYEFICFDKPPSD